MEINPFFKKILNFLLIILILISISIIEIHFPIYTKKLIQNPSDFMIDENAISKLKRVISGVIDDIIIDLNGEVNDLGEDFDYKSKLRDESWVKELSRNIVSNYQKLVNRKRINSFSEEWNKI